MTTATVGVRPTGTDYPTRAHRNLVTPGSRAHLALLSCGAIGSVAFSLTFLIAGSLRPGYDPWREPISALSLGAGGWIQLTNFLVFGILGIASAVGIRATLTPGRGATWAPVLRIGSGLSMILVGFFAQDPDGTYPVDVAAPASASTHAMIHQIGSFVSLTATVAYCLVLASRLAREPRWRGWATWLRVTAVLMMACLATFGTMMGMHSGPAGMFEKAASIVPGILGVVLTARLLMHRGRL
jgi:hypothetical membrane protein